MTSVNLAGQMKVSCRPGHCSRRADRIQLDWENIINIPHDVMNEDFNGHNLMSFDFLSLKSSKTKKNPMEQISYFI